MVVAIPLFGDEVALEAIASGADVPPRFAVDPVELTPFLDDQGNGHATFALTEVPIGFETTVVTFRAIAEHLGCSLQADQAADGLEAIELAREAVPPAERWNPKKVIYCSSADRGLLHLLRMWPHVLDEEPDATLEVFYPLHLMRFAENPPVWFDVVVTGRNP